KGLKGNSDNINRANDPGAEPAWFEQEHGFRFNGCSHHLSFSIAGKAKSLIPKYKTQPDGSTKRSATAGFGIDWRLQWGEWMPFRGCSNSRIGFQHLLGMPEGSLSQSGAT